MLFFYIWINVIFITFIIIIIIIIIIYGFWFVPNHFVSEIVKHLIYICIYSHPQTDLFRSIRTHQCG